VAKHLAAVTDLPHLRPDIRAIATMPLVLLGAGNRYSLSENLSPPNVDWWDIKMLLQCPQGGAYQWLSLRFCEVVLVNQLNARSRNPVLLRVFSALVFQPSLP